MKNWIYEMGLVIVAIIWGSGFAGTKLALDGGFTPVQIITSRFLIGSILLNIIFIKKIKRKVNTRILKKGFTLGFLLFSSFLVQTIGLLYTTPSKNAFITTSNVVIVPFLGYIFYKRKVNISGIIGSIITIIGIGILSLEEGLSINIGDLLTLLSAFGFACHIFFTSEYVENEDPIVLTAIQFNAVFILSFFTQILLGEFSINSSIIGYIGVGCLGFFNTAISFLIQTLCQKKVSETKTAIILSTESVFGVIFSVIILSEVITGKIIIGSILIFISIIISENNTKHRNKYSFSFRSKNIN